MNSLPNVLPICQSLPCHLDLPPLNNSPIPGMEVGQQIFSNPHPSKIGAAEDTWSSVKAAKDGSRECLELNSAISVIETIRKETQRSSPSNDIIGISILKSAPVSVLQ